MSFFEKLKNLHSGPPAPPRKTDNNGDFGWASDEFDDEEGDMYEAPPCKPDVKMPQRQREEDVYLDRRSTPAPPSRLSTAPKPQQRSNFSFDPNTGKPPEIDRNEKPGRKKVPPPPPPPEEDVYLDPNGEEESDDVYLEPTEACSPPSPPAPPLPSNTRPAHKPPMKRPPVPRGMSNLFLPSLTEVKPVPSVEEKRTFPNKLLPPVSVNPSMPANQREVRLSNPNPPPADVKPVATFVNNVKRSSKHCEHEDKEWFAGDCNRTTSIELLQRVNKDGAFLIRRSSAQSPRQPYTLAVLYQQKVFNVPIRFLEDTLSYALGKEGKKSEEIFASLDEMISHHKNHQLLLIDNKSQAKHMTYLIHPVRP